MLTIFNIPHYHFNFKFFIIVELQDLHVFKIDQFKYNIITNKSRYYISRISN